MSENLRDWLQLSLADGLGPVLTQRLLARAAGLEGDELPASLANRAISPGAAARAACGFAVRELECINGIGPSKASAIRRALDAAAGSAETELRNALAQGVTMLCPDDDAFPVMLRTIPDPPVVLFVRGAIEPRDLNGLAIVGSRRCSNYGREQADRFAALLAGAGFTIISGGAYGVDSAAHRGALRHPAGRTIAVLGSGVDIAYPPENAPLYDLISGKGAAPRGAVISEYPLGTPPLRENFPRRNRIIAGMARGVLVIEAAERSGALITARVACDDHGRPVFALPGRVDNPMSAGPHKLIRDGAVLVTCLDDILHDLGPFSAEATDPPGALTADLFNEAALPSDDRMIEDAASMRMVLAPMVHEMANAAAKKSSPRIGGRAGRILAALEGDELSADQLIEQTGLSAAEVMSELTLLSLRGQVKRVDGNTYCAV